MLLACSCGTRQIGARVQRSYVAYYALLLTRAARSIHAYAVRVPGLCTCVCVARARPETARSRRKLQSYYIVQRGHVLRRITHARV